MLSDGVEIWSGILWRRLRELRNLRVEAGGLHNQPPEEVHWVLQDLVLQQGVPGGALAQGAQEALQVLLWQETFGGVGLAQEGDLWPLHQAEGCWEESLQRGESNLRLPLRPHLQLQQKCKGQFVSPRPVPDALK